MDYSELPEDIAEKIAKEHLETFSQLAAFSRTCRSWRSTALRLHGGRPLCPPSLVVSKAAATTTASQSGLEAYYNSGQIHQLYPLTTTVFPANPKRPTPPPIPRATLPFLPSPSKISDAQGQRLRYLRRHDDLLTSLHDDELAASVDPHHSDDHHDQCFSDDDDNHYYGYWSEEEYDEYNAKDAQSLGSKDGWILRSLPSRGGDSSCQGRTLDLYLLNPITGASIPLPPLRASSPTHTRDICKAIISSSPDDGDEEEGCHVIILSTSDPQLAWCNVGESQAAAAGGWNFTNKGSHIFESPHDAIYFGGKLYVVDRRRIYVIDHRRLGSSSSSSSAVRAFPFSEAMLSCCSNDSDSDSDYYFEYYDERMACYHLFQLDGELHVVSRQYYHVALQLVFQVYKLVVVPPVNGGSSSPRYYWEEVRSLDGRAVFIGGHQSFCHPAAASNTVALCNGVGGNRIYFALGCRRTRRRRSDCGGWNGVFHLANRKFERSALMKYCISYGKSCYSFWFLPMPWDISKLHRKHHSRKKKKAWKREKSLQLCTTNETADQYYWTLPKKTIKNKNRHDKSTIDKVTRHNRFRALLSDADNEEDEED